AMVTGRDVTKAASQSLNEFFQQGVTGGDQVNVMFEQLLDLLNKAPEVFKKLSPEVATFLEAASASALYANGGKLKASDMKELLKGAVMKAAEFKALDTTQSRAASEIDTESDIAKDEKVADERTKMMTATLEALKAEERLTAIRGGDGLTANRAIIAIE